MAHRIGLNDTVYEPDIHHTTQDFSFFDDEDSEERTKGQVIVPKCDNSNTSVEQRNGFVECVVNSETAPETSVGLSCSASRPLSQLIPAKGLPLVHLEDTSYAGQGGTPDQSGWYLGTSEGHTEDPRRPPLEQSEGNNSGPWRGCGSGAEAALAYAAATEGAEEQLRLQGSDPPFEGQAASPAAQAESAGAAATNTTDMERADLNPYSSDEWEDSEISDSASDHSDSSDDDDPKSQVDRLIERGTRLYMDGTDSNVSESDSSDEDDDFSDSESDITDVSPLVSGKSSPMRLSPIMARRSNSCTSPLALHDNKNLEFDWSAGQNTSKYLEDNHHSSDQGYESTHPSHFNNTTYLHHDNLSTDDPTDMTLLLQAVIDLEKSQHKSSHNNRRVGQHLRNGDLPGHHPNNHHNMSSPHQPLSTIHASPHTRHLNTPHKRTQRKNMSFSNEEVRRIDRENQILLQKIMTAHTAPKRNTSSGGGSHNVHHRGPVHKTSNSSVMRRREEEKIRRENVILLRKIQEAKPSRDVAATTTRSPRYHHHHHRPSSNHYHHHHHHHHIGSTGSISNSSNSLTVASAASGSCGASARSAGSHGVGVATPTSRKETAL